MTNRITALFGITEPLLLAPMAGAGTVDLALAVAEAGGLGALACAMLTPEQIRRDLSIYRQRTTAPVNLNFFVHTQPQPDPAREVAWRARLDAYYTEHGVDRSKITAANRAPLDAEGCAIIEAFKPAVVSFHFGLPAADLLGRVRATGAKLVASATTVAEARWLEANGCDAIIAQGFEAGGHRGHFLIDDTNDVSGQVGTMALVPQIVDAVRVPVIAAGGLSDGRTIAAAFVLGADAVQVGTAYLKTPEAQISAVHRAALERVGTDGTALTNLFTGRPARGVPNRLMRDVGPIAAVAPTFPTAGGALAPLKTAAEAQGRDDFSSLWSGQAAPLVPRGLGAGELTRHLLADARRRLAAASVLN
jgi:nitronate monooxygenase